LITNPAFFASDLTNDRLNAIACVLLDARYKALIDANTELDGPYTKGCLAFGRQRQAIIKAWKDGLYPWLSIRHAGSDLIFCIGSISVRFFTDDPNVPKKTAVLIPTQAEQLTIFEPNSNNVVLWRFILKPASNKDEDDSVFFVGINEFNEIICRWKYTDSVMVLHSIDETTPAAKELNAAPILPKTEDGAVKQQQDNV
jgi:hypothetical protein